MRRLLLPTELKACVNAPPGWHKTEGQKPWQKGQDPRQWREMQDSNLRGFYTRRFSGPFPSTTRTISQIQVAALRTDCLFAGPTSASTPPSPIRAMPWTPGLIIALPVSMAAHAPTRCTPKVRSWSGRRGSNPRNLRLGGTVLYQLSYYRIEDC